MIISSWNVNSIRARILNVQEYLKKFDPDVVLVQEIKTQDETYPYDDVKKIKYESYVFGQKSYNGVAILSKKKLDNIQKDIFKLRDIETGTIMSRAFKPMPIILDLVQKNFRKYKNIILFMGKSGRKILDETLKIWDLDYEEKKSLTNKDSFLLNIKNMEKKI